MPRLAAVVNQFSSSRGARPSGASPRVEVAEGYFESADIAYCAPPATRPPSSGLRMSAAPRRVSERLAYWFARDGGWAQDACAMTPAELARRRRAFAHCESIIRGVDVLEWIEAIRPPRGIRNLVPAGVRSAPIPVVGAMAPIPLARQPVGASLELRRDPTRSRVVLAEGAQLPPIVRGPPSVELSRADRPLDAGAPSTATRDEATR